MPATLEIESTLTDRYQTTIPDTVRKALGLSKRDKLHYSIRPGGEVLLTRADTSNDDDPAISAFLTFLAQDITAHPDRLHALPASSADSLRDLASKVGKLDLNAPLSEADE
jgi:antitoxin PrlF